MAESKSDYNVRTLRKICNMLNLPTSGVKIVLTRRIIDYFTEMSSANNGNPITICQQQCTSQPVKSKHMFFTTALKSVIPSMPKLPGFLTSDSSCLDKSNNNNNSIVNLQINHPLQYFQQFLRVIVPCFALFGGTYALHQLFISVFGIEKIQATVTKHFWA